MLPASTVASRSISVRAPLCQAPRLPPSGWHSLRPGSVPPWYAPPPRELLPPAQATKKGGGVAKNGRDSVGQRRGIKIYGDQPVKAGGIIVRQLGNQFWPGSNVGIGKDYTLYALISGVVRYMKNSVRRRVDVLPVEEWTAPTPIPRSAGNRRVRARLRQGMEAEARREATRAAVEAARERVRAAEEANAKAAAAAV